MRNRGLHSCVLSFRLSCAREREGSKDEGGRRRISRRSSSAFLAPAALQPGLRPRRQVLRRACLPNHRASVRRSMRRVLIGRFLARIEIFSPGFFLGSRTAEPASVVFQMRTREDKADLGPPGDRGVRVTRSLGCGWDPPGVALTPGARVARHAHRHHVRHSGHVRRQRLRARRCVDRPHRARASSRGAPRGVAVLDIVPPFFFPSASSRGTIMTTSDAPRARAALGADLAPDLARRLTTLPRAPASLPPQPPRRNAPTPPGTRARERRPRSSSEARLRHRRDDASEAMRVNRSLDPFPSAHFPGCR